MKKLILLILPAIMLLGTSCLQREPENLKLDIAIGGPTITDAGSVRDQINDQTTKINMAKKISFKFSYQNPQIIDEKDYIKKISLKQIFVTTPIQGTPKLMKNFNNESNESIIQSFENAKNQESHPTELIYENPGQPLFQATETYNLDFYVAFLGLDPLGEGTEIINTQENYAVQVLFIMEIESEKGGTWTQNRTIVIPSSGN